MSIEFEDYNRIVDTLIYFSDTITLDFIVNLSKKTRMGGRQFFHFEAEYGADGGGTLRSIKRNMNFYFCINNREVFANGIILRPQDIEILKMVIDNKVLPWFFGTPQQYAFQVVDNRLALKEYTEVFYSQSESKYIKFEPMVYEYQDNTFTQGIRMRLASGEALEMNIDKFMGFFYLIKCDMYAAATNLVCYAKTPPYGINELKVGGLGTGKQTDNWNSEKNNYRGNGVNSFLNNAKPKE